MKIQHATQENARDLARLIDLAGEGIPSYLWSQLAEPGQDALAVGEQRAARDEGGFSYKNARVCVEDDELMGMIIAYRLPAPYEAGTLAEYPDIIRPLIELESKAPGSWYINAIATFEKFRGRGVATALIKESEEQGRREGCRLASLIVASENRGARHLYEHLGYRDNASLPLVPIPGGIADGSWLLMTKAL